MQVGANLIFPARLYRGCVTVLRSSRLHSTMIKVLQGSPTETSAQWHVDRALAERRKGRVAGTGRLAAESRGQLLTLGAVTSVLYLAIYVEQRVIFDGIDGLSDAAAILLYVLSTVGVLRVYVRVLALSRGILDAGNRWVAFGFPVGFYLLWLPTAPVFSSERLLLHLAWVRPHRPRSEPVRRDQRRRHLTAARAGPVVFRLVAGAGADPIWAGDQPHRGSGGVTLKVATCCRA